MSKYDPSTYRKLFYNSVTFDGVDSSFGPNLICQKCGTHYKDDKTISTTTNVIKNSQKRVFTCPKCKTTIEFYVAVARTREGKQGILISVNPIDPDWLEKEVLMAKEIEK